VLGSAGTVTGAVYVAAGMTTAVVPEIHYRSLPADSTVAPSAGNVIPVRSSKSLPGQRYGRCKDEECGYVQYLKVTPTPTVEAMRQLLEPPAVESAGVSLRIISCSW
jgi:hypothetical protein